MRTFATSYDKRISTYSSQSLCPARRLLPVPRLGGEFSGRRQRTHLVVGLASGPVHAVLRGLASREFPQLRPRRRHLLPTRTGLYVLHLFLCITALRRGAVHLFPLLRRRTAHRLSQRRHRSARARL